MARTKTQLDADFYTTLNAAWNDLYGTDYDLAAQDYEKRQSQPEPKPVTYRGIVIG